MMAPRIQERTISSVLVEESRSDQYGDAGEGAMLEPSQARGMGDMAGAKLGPSPCACAGREDKTKGSRPRGMQL